MRLMTHLFSFFLLSSSLIPITTAFSSGTSAPLPQQDSRSIQCDDIHSLPPSTDTCAFVRSKCNSSGFINFIQFYYCHVDTRPFIFKAATVACACASLVLLFRIISRAADEFFSSILSQISQDMGLPPRLGGVTLLALGNGAPDLSSSIAAVRSGNYPLALGALTGGTMFVGCVVAGSIISSSKSGIKSRGAQIRDVSMQFVAVLVVAIIIALGSVTYINIVQLLSLYCVYVVIVAVADFTKRAGVEWEEIGRGLSQRISQHVSGNGLRRPLLESQREDFEDNDILHGGDEYLDQGRENEEDVPADAVVQPTVTRIACTTSSTPPVTTSVHSNTLPEKIESNADSHDGSLPESTTSEVEMIVTSPGSRSPTTKGSVTELQSLGPSIHNTTGPVSNVQRSQQTPALSIGYDEIMHMPVKEYRQRALADMAAAKSFYTKKKKSTTRENNEIPGYQIERLKEEEEGEEEEQQQEEDVDIERGSSLYIPPTIPGTVLFESDIHSDSIPHALSPPPTTNLHRSNEFETQHNQHIQKMFDKLDICARPVMYLLQSTIPLLETSCYQHFWFILSMATSPLFICLYLDQIHFKPIFISLITGALVSSLCYVATCSKKEQPPMWDLGTGYPIGAGIIALYGFAVAAMWIDIFASQIVSLLHFLGILAHISPSVLGITILAWGNSLTDFVANTTMATKKSAGGVSMAMTACFAGPLFNILVGLGVGFWALLADSQQTSIPVEFDPVIIVGCVFAMMNCAGIVTVGILNKHWLPARFGLTMIAWYVLYICVMLFVVVVSNP